MLSQNDLLNFRHKINNIDKKIVMLLAKRKKLILDIAQSKIQNNQPIRDINREKNLLSNLTDLGRKKNLNTNYIQRLFTLIIEESVLTQKKLLEKFRTQRDTNKTIISFLGDEGSYSYIALSRYKKHNIKNIIRRKCSNFEEVVQSVENNESNYAILPIENTCSGPINEIFNILKNINLFIVGEIYVDINHCLLAIEKVELNTIQKVYSHSQPFKQCSNFINQFPHWKIEHTHSTTDAMKKIIQKNEKTNAVLGSEISSKIYKLKILCQNISNIKNNITRFVCLSKKPYKIDLDKQVKTTIIFSLKKEKQELSKILSTLEPKNIMVKMLNFYNDNTKDQMFYLDIEKKISSNTMQNIFKKIQKISKFIKILGCYPSANKKLF
ncbi:prephenate dehydratase [Buchnera aphidicola (Aphis glycines)]|uniref:Bifunctional chorismate mutase/prephenate dehydratase n=1 Tax=Buchnera aphidicola (Aphis glycines) TaxID=1265350 RepID=A0A0M3RSD9_9GAMM|nr:chorismate mutase [Buchnera aphidicola]ALD15330.1 prephenate dehydratase [Buchnera aphidicola (Aphis glycines)]